MIELHWINPKFLGGMWKSIADKIEPALEYSDGALTIDNVKEMLENHKLQLWVVCRESDKKVLMCVCTKMSVHASGKKTCTLMLAGGTVEGEPQIFREIADKLSDWAKIENCDAVEICGRRGWARIIGWEVTQTTIRKKLK